MERINLTLKAIALVLSIIVFIWYVKITRYEIISPGNTLVAVIQHDKWTGKVTTLRYDEHYREYFPKDHEY
jgi:hypothetical protein